MPVAFHRSVQTHPCAFWTFFFYLIFCGLHGKVQENN